MLRIRNVAFGIVALGFVAGSSARAENNVVTNGNITAVLIAPNQSLENGAGTVDCSTATLCTFTRVPPLDPGTNAQAALFVTSADGVNVHVHIQIWSVARCAGVADLVDDA